MVSPFGNAQSSSIFSNQPRNQNQPTSIFGNPAQPAQAQQGSIFGAPNNNTGNVTSAFGSTNPTTSATGSSIFGSSTGQQSSSIFNSNPNQQQGNTSIFGASAAPAQQNSIFGQSNNQPSSSIFGSSLNAQPSVNPVFANNNNNLFKGNNFPQNPSNFQSQTITSTKPILTLQSSNSLRYSKIDQLTEATKEMAKRIQLDLQNNTLHINYAENLIKKLEQNFAVVKSEGINVVKFSKVINTKNTKIKLILNNIKSEMKKLNDSLEKEKSNYRVLELNNEMNIPIPNDFLLYFTSELEERMRSYSAQIEDIQTLINLYYSEENGSFSVNSDMVEELIVELYKCIKILLNDEAMLNDYVSNVKASFAELLKSHGFNEYQIKAKFESYLDE